MASNPVFGSEDRVSSTQLPAELKGVTDPIKIAEYYQRREARLREELRQPPVTSPNSRVTMTRETENQPAPRGSDPANLTVAEAEAARDTLIESARNVARTGKPYWDRLSQDIETLMAKCPPEDRVSSRIWETCYHTLVGMNKEKLDREDRERAETAIRTAAEKSSAPPESQTPPPPLPIEVTGKILPGLNLSEEQYRISQDRISKGVWPLTAENVSGKRVTIGDK